jgi:hypothetical protein
MPSYVFSVNKVEVHNNRSRGQHNDSDWLSMILKVNDQVRNVGPFNIGPNIHGGDVLTGPWTLGPVQINDTDNVSLTYLVVNLGHVDDGNAQLGLAIQVYTAYIGAVASTAPPWGPVVGAFVAGIGQVIGWAIGLDKSNPNCDGEVLHDAFEYPPGQLIRQGTPHTVSNDYTENTPSECGNPPQTTVIYSIIDASSVKQMMMIRGFDPGQGFRHIQPAVTSLRAFMTL